ncbi:hypothetical protein N9444_09965, partial [Gammaproteobacteria bacterium]|nr:hypothetical protein [Gammaproteobacteria bacterium]
GGSTGGGATGGGRDEGATEDDSTGPPVTDDGGQDGATCKVSPYGPFGGAKLEVTGAFSKSGDQYTVKPSEYATFKCKELCGDVTVKETKTRLTCSSQGSGVFDKKLPICEVASGACLHYPDSEEDKKQSCKWGNLRTAVLGDRYVKSDHYTVKAQWRQVVPDGGVATYALPNAEYSDAKLCGAGAAAQKLPAHTRTCTDGTWTPPPTLECPPAKCGDGSVKGKALCDEIDAKCVKTLRDIHKGETLACLKTGNMCLARCNKEFGSETTVCHIGCGKKWRECKDGIKYNKDGFDWTLFDETAAKAACSRD